MIRKLCALLAVTSAFGCTSMMSHPALPASGQFVTQLGDDTLSIERYTRTAERLDGDVLLRSPRVRNLHYTASLAPNGQMTSLMIEGRRPTTPAGSPSQFTQKIIFGPTTVVETMRNGVRDTTNSGVRTYQGMGVGTLPSEPPSYGIYEQIIAANLTGHATVALKQVGGPGPPVAPLALSWRGPDFVQFSSNFFPGTPWIEVASFRDGRITGVNSKGTTIKTISHRDDGFDFARVMSGWVAQEAGGKVMGSTSVLDTTRATISGSNMEVVYSRPMRRGRVIFGDVVPWGEVWRTGANAATQLTTSRDLVVGGTLVPAGKYTLWTLPTATGAQLIINSQTGQWGTDYDSKRDFARIPLTTTMLPSAMDRFTIALDPTGTGGTLRMAWGDRAYWVPFTVK